MKDDKSYICLVSLLVIATLVIPSYGIVEALTGEDKISIDESNLMLVNFDESKLQSDSGRSFIDASEVKSDSCIIINGGKEISSELSRAMEDAIYDGAAVALVGGNYEPLLNIGSKLMANSGVEGIQAYGIKYDQERDKQYLFKVAGFDSEYKAVEQMYKMMDEVQNEKKIVESNTRDVVEGISGEVQSIFSYNCGSAGIMNIRTSYLEVEDSSENYNFYLVHYKLQSVCYDGHSKAYMGFEADVDADETYGEYQHISEYYPTTESGSTTVSFGFNVGGGYDGGPSATGGLNVSWSHSYPDVSSIDNSDLSQELFNITYDINECTNSGYNTLMVEPGLAVACSMNGDGNYHIVEEYRTQFCDIVIRGLWHNNFTFYYVYDDIVFNGEYA